MTVLAFAGFLLLVLAVAGFIADRWPTDDDRSVNEFTRQMAALGGGKGTPAERTESDG